MSFVKNAERQLVLQYRQLNAHVSRTSSAVTKKLITEAAARYNEGTSLSNIDGKFIAVKDNICTRDLPTTCASEILRNFRSPFDATVVKLIRNGGGIIMGKTSLDEFGMGSHNMNTKDGCVWNPHSLNNARLSAGGSSGGSAVAVAEGSCFAALGTDTGGSVRLPAAYCGVVGFKPSYGRISRFGTVAYANSLDTVGILAKEVDDIRQVFLQVDISDVHDPTSLSVADRQSLRRSSAEKEGRIRIGLPVEYQTKEIQSSVLKTWQATTNALIDGGYEVVPVSLPSTRAALAAYYILAPAEASSNLAKYDGVRYGNPSSDARNKPDVLFSKTRLDGFGEEVRRRILLGSFSLSSNSIDNYFIQAQRIRRQVQMDFNSIFSTPHPFLDPSPEQALPSIDILLTPTAPTEARALENVEQKSSVEGYQDDVFTVPASLAGLPAISVPFGSRKGKLPVGMQLIGQYGDDNFVLAMAERLEKIAKTL